jgi:hypothetical protein
MSLQLVMTTLAIARFTILLRKQWQAPAHTDMFIVSLLTSRSSVGNATFPSTFNAERLIKTSRSEPFTYLLIYSMEKSPSWEANQFANSQEIPCISMELESSLPYSQVPVTCPYLSQLHPVPTTPSNFLKIHLNTILPVSALKIKIPNTKSRHASLRRGF